MSTVRQDAQPCAVQSCDGPRTIARVDVAQGRYKVNGLDTHRVTFTDGTTADSLWLTHDKANGPLKVGDVVVSDIAEPGSIRRGDYGVEH